MAVADWPSGLPIQALPLGLPWEVLGPAGFLLAPSVNSLSLSSGHQGGAKKKLGTVLEGSGSAQFSPCASVHQEGIMGSCP